MGRLSRDRACRTRRPPWQSSGARRRGELGEPVVSNGLSLCSIDHRAFDENLVGVSPDLRVHVSPRLPDDDGPMLDLLKGFHRQEIRVPTRPSWRPDPERLALRFERFQASA